MGALSEAKIKQQVITLKRIIAEKDDIITQIRQACSRCARITPDECWEALAEQRRQIEAAIEAASYNGEIGCKRDWIYKTEAFAAIAAACEEMAALIISTDTDVTVETMSPSKHLTKKKEGGSNENC